VGSLLVLGSAGLGVVGTVFFTQFLRNVASCFDDRRLIRQVDGSVGLLGLLVGGSVGLLLCTRGLSWLPALWLGVGGCWVGCLAWQACLCARAGWRIEGTLRARDRTREGPPAEVVTRAVGVRTLSGLRRIINQSP
jgi:hypothetical protein